MTKSWESYSFGTPLELEIEWLIGLTSLGVFNSVFKINENNNNVKLFFDDGMEENGEGVATLLFGDSGKGNVDFDSGDDKTNEQLKLDNVIKLQETKIFRKVILKQKLSSTHEEKNSHLFR